MVGIELSDRAGNAVSIIGDAGGTLMEAIRDSGFSDAFATCGGCLSCATCHVYVEPVREGSISPRGDDEEDLLSALQYRDGRSRLSCQVYLFDDTPRLHVTIAPEE